MNRDSPPLERKKGWFARNWPWLIPGGCLIGLALIAAFTIGILFFVTGLLKSSEPYATALQAANENPEVQEAIGIPIEDGFFVAGSINYQNANGDADLRIPIEGPKGSATLYVVAEKSAGQWTYTTLLVEVKATNERIVLPLPE